MLRRSCRGFLNFHLGTGFVNQWPLLYICTTDTADWPRWTRRGSRRSSTSTGSGRGRCVRSRYRSAGSGVDATVLRCRSEIGRWRQRLFRWRTERQRSTLISRRTSSLPSSAAPPESTNQSFHFISPIKHTTTTNAGQSPTWGHPALCVRLGTQGWPNKSLLQKKFPPSKKCEAHIPLIRALTVIIAALEQVLTISWVAFSTNSWQSPKFTMLVKTVRPHALFEKKYSAKQCDSIQHKTDCFDFDTMMILLRW